MGETFDIDIDATDPKSPEGKDVCEQCDTLLSVRGIKKSFGSNEVLKGINLDLAPGEVISLIGGNGSGKSTLMKIIMGIYSADEGEISIDRQKVDISNPKAALAHSIYMVPQEPMLFPNMTVRENITIGFEAPKAELNKMLEDTMKEIGWELDLDRKAMTLSIAEQGMVEILRGLMRHSEILILDEPTSALTFDEVQSLFKVVQELKQKNIGIIYITHRLAEVFEISTSIGILRDGVMAMRGKVEDFTREDLVRGLLPPDAAEIKKEIAESANIDYDAEPIFELAEFTGYGFADVNLNIYPGEIVGLAGIDGNGQKELADAINALVKPESGTITVKGEEIQGTTPKTVIDHAVATIPSDRHRWGLVLPFTVAENMVLERHNEETFGKGIALDLAKIKEFSQKLIDEFDIRPAECADHQAVGLSGGNQQKVIIAREVSSNPDVLIAIQPTRGLDVGAIEFVHKALIRERDRGAAILLISFELDEIMDVADKMAIIYAGKNVGEFDQGTITEEQAGLLMAGGDAE